MRTNNRRYHINVRYHALEELFFQRIHVTLMIYIHHTGGNIMCKIRSIKQAADYFKQLDPEIRFFKIPIFQKFESFKKITPN